MNWKKKLTAYAHAHKEHGYITGTSCVSVPHYDTHNANNTSLINQTQRQNQE